MPPPFPTPHPRYPPHRGPPRYPPPGFVYEPSPSTDLEQWVHRVPTTSPPPTEPTLPSMPTDDAPPPSKRASRTKSEPEAPSNPPVMSGALPPSSKSSRSNRSNRRSGAPQGSPTSIATEPPTSDHRQALPRKQQTSTAPAHQAEYTDGYVSSVPGSSPSRRSHTGRVKQASRDEERVRAGFRHVSVTRTVRFTPSTDYYATQGGPQGGPQVGSTHGETEHREKIRHGPASRETGSHGRSGSESTFEKKAGETRDGTRHEEAAERGTHGARSLYASTERAPTPGHELPRATFSGRRPPTSRETGRSDRHNASLAENAKAATAGLGGSKKETSEKGDVRRYTLDSDKKATAASQTDREERASTVAAAAAAAAAGKARSRLLRSPHSTRSQEPDHESSERTPRTFRAEPADHAVDKTTVETAWSSQSPVDTYSERSFRTRAAREDWGTAIGRVEPRTHITPDSLTASDSLSRGWNPPADPNWCETFEGSPRKTEREQRPRAQFTTSLEDGKLHGNNRGPGYSCFVPPEVAAAAAAAPPDEYVTVRRTTYRQFSPTTAQRVAERARDRQEVQVRYSTTRKDSRKDSIAPRRAAVDTASGFSNQASEKTRYRSGSNQDPDAARRGTETADSSRSFTRLPRSELQDDRRRERPRSPLRQEQHYEHRRRPTEARALRGRIPSLRSDHGSTLREPSLNLVYEFQVDDREQVEQVEREQAARRRNADERVYCGVCRSRRSERTSANARFCPSCYGPKARAWTESMHPEEAARQERPVSERRRAWEQTRREYRERERRDVEREGGGEPREVRGWK